MAAAPLTNQDLRVIPLKEADPQELDSLFDEQCAEWLALLKWDYTGPSRMIREVSRQRELSGYAVMSDKTAVGFSYYIIESSRCSIGDIYVTKDWRASGADRLMAARIVEQVDAAGHARRIESQCVTIGNVGAADFFESRGFNRFERDYMICDLAGLASEPRTEATHRLDEKLADISIREWRDEDFAQAARVIHRSYRGQHDSRINNQYATEEGCAELLSVLTDHLWCGDFLAPVARVVVRRETGSLIGVLIASRLATGAGHIGQISIDPAYQDMGLGRRMISSAIAEFDRRGFNSVSLAVTTANASAFHLYKSCGFRTVHTFPVFYQERE
jgi:ribosomal protein S18 acetylase RimI-like enzyme